MNKTFYNLSDGGRFDATRAKLALFDRNTLADIIALVNYRGSGLINDIHSNPNDFDPPHIFGILDPTIVAYRDQQEVLLGMATVMLSGLREQRLSQQDYQRVLQKAFSIPAPLAFKYAQKIETPDTIMVDTDQSGSNEWTEYLAYVRNWADSFVGTVVNKALSLTGLDTYFNWDKNQSNDVDAMFEFAQLGETVAELGKRGRLVQSYATVNRNFGSIMAGDAETDAYTADSLAIGDAISCLNNKQLPGTLLGKWGDVEKAGKHAAAKFIKDKANDAGYSVHNGEIMQGEPKPKGQHLPNVIESLLNSSPNKLILLGLIGGLGVPVAVNMIKKLTALNARPSGDADVRDLYGDVIADALQDGDVDGAVAEYLRAGESDFLAEEGITGDAADDIVSQVLEGDVDDEHFDDVTTGDIFSRARTNMAIKRAARTSNRMDRKEQKFNAKMAAKTARGQAVATRKSDYMRVAPPSRPSSRPQAEPEYEFDQEQLSPSDDDQVSSFDMGLDQFDN